MILFAIKTDNIQSVHDWFRQLKDRSKENNVLKNPFNIIFKQYKRKESLLTVISVRPIYPNFTWIGWLSGLGILIAFGSTYWLIPCAVIGCLGYFWTPDFYFLVTKLGLKKAGCKNVKRMKLGEFIQETIL